MVSTIQRIFIKQLPTVQVMPIVLRFACSMGKKVSPENFIYFGQFINQGIFTKEKPRFWSLKVT